MLCSASLLWLRIEGTYSRALLWSFDLIPVMEDLSLVQPGEEAPWHNETKEFGSLDVFGCRGGRTHSRARVILHQFWEI